MKITRTARFGRATEHLVFSKLLLEGYKLGYPDSDVGEDCYILRNERYFGVQIKGRSIESKISIAGAFTQLKVDNPRENYVFVFYCEHMQSFWIIPSLKLVEISRKRSEGTYDIRFVGKKNGQPHIKEKFEEYRNQKGWDNLKSYLERNERKN